MMRAGIAGIAICVAPCVLGAEAGSWSAGIGAQYTTGDYGTSRTTQILAIPFSVRYERDPWTYKLALPYYFVSGGASVIPGLGAVDAANRRGKGRAEATTSGLGDATASATYAAYYDPASRLGVDLTGRVKLPTAEEDKGLGTGSYDAGMQVDAYKTQERLTFFGGIGYTVFGSSFLALQNAVNYTLGGSIRLDARDSAGFSYDERRRAAQGFPDQRELTAFFTRAIDKRWKGQAYFLKGLANGSPDWGIGASVAYGF